MNRMSWDGHDLMAAMRHAGAVLHSNLDEVNALNVFPVPDGDTGSNMLATIQAAVAEAESVPPLERTPTRISSALSLGALMGARGNSGVILSQLLRGIGEAISGHERVTAPVLIEAFKRGCTTAFSSVAHPVEGTMLTVARDVSEAAEKAPPGDGSIEHLLRVAVDEAAASVQRTPSLLPVLKEAGVVDAGGRGIELLLRGALASIQGDHLPHGMKLANDIALPTWDALEAEGYGYETVFVILPPEGARLDVAAIRARLDRMAESVLVAGDDRAVKIHVHNERPDEVIGYGLTLGTLSRITIENLDRQATDVRERARVSTEAASISGAAPLREGPAVIAVAAGDGLARVFSSLGATGVVQGGQGANPSVGELADAIRASGNDQVIVLPNNPNVRLAAKQAGELCEGVKVEVVPTRNAGEGVAAMLAFDPDASLRDSAKAMTQAGKAVQTLQVSLAVRDARMGRHKVHRGDYIVLGPTDGLVAAHADRTAAIRTGIGLLKNGFELLTLYRGRDVDHAAGQELRDQLATELDGVEIELVEGGQPHYDFLISAE
jgi:DAK2 domain fusion protein YloV